METLIKLKEVQKRSGLSRTMVYELMRRKEFPQSIAVSKRGVAWIEHEVAQWIHRKISKSRMRAGNSPVFRGEQMELKFDHF